MDDKKTVYPITKLWGGSGYHVPFYNQVLLRKFLITYNSAAADQKPFIFGTWEGSLPFYIYGPLGHAPGRG